MFVERLLQAINDLFAKFWLVVLILLPIIFILGLILN